MLGTKPNPSSVCLFSLLAEANSLPKKHQKQACWARVELGLKHTHYCRVSHTTTLGQFGDLTQKQTNKKKTYNTNMISISITDTDWTLSLSLFPCAHFSHTWPDISTSTAVSVHCQCPRVFTQQLLAKGNLFRCARGRLNFNHVKWETRNQDVTVKSMQLQKHKPWCFECSADDNTPRASPYTTD